MVSNALGSEKKPNVDTFIFFIYFLYKTFSMEKKKLSDYLKICMEFFRTSSFSLFLIDFEFIIPDISGGLIFLEFCFSYDKWKMRAEKENGICKSDIKLFIRKCSETLRCV